MSSEFKQTAKDFIDELPDVSNWNELIYELIVRREIELGLEDSNEGRLTTVDDVLKEFGFDE